MIKLIIKATVYNWVYLNRITHLPSQTPCIFKNTHLQKLKFRPSVLPNIVIIKKKKNKK